MLPPGALPTFTVFAGPNGAGKSTLRQILERGGAHTGPFVNADEIAATLDPAIENRDLTAGREAIRQAQRLIDEGRSFAQETTLTGRFALRLMRRCREAGFRIALFYVGVDSPAISKGRIENRVALGGHDIPLEDQDRRFARSFANLPLAFEEADIAVLYDNSLPTRGYRLVAAIERGVVTVEEAGVAAWADRPLASLPRRLDRDGEASALASRLSTLVTASRRG